MKGNLNKKIQFWRTLQKIEILTRTDNPESKRNVVKQKIKQCRNNYLIEKGSGYAIISTIASILLTLVLFSIFCKVKLQCYAGP